MGSRSASRSCRVCLARVSRSPPDASSARPRLAARFSFLLLVPRRGAAIYKGLKDVVLGDLPPGWPGPFVVGIVSAAGSGLLAIHWLLGYVRRHDYTVFVIYRLVAAAVILLLIATGVREATF